MQAVAEKLPGTEQYAVLKAAEAFEAIPRLLAESAGLNATGNSLVPLLRSFLSIKD